MKEQLDAIRESIDDAREPHIREYQVCLMAKRYECKLDLWDGSPMTGNKFRVNKTREMQEVDAEIDAE